MPNSYTEIYDNSKNILNDFLDGALFALSDLVEGRLQEKTLPKHKSKSNNLEEIKLFRGPSPVFKNELPIIEDIIKKIKQLQLLDSNENKRKEFKKILLSKRNLLTSVFAKDLIDHIILDISTIDYNNRPSARVKPDSAEMILNDAEAVSIEFSSVKSVEWSRSISISHLLKTKNLPENIFNHATKITLKSDFSEHVAWAFENIYQFLYPNSQGKEGINRFHHGIQHVTRASTYVPVLANLYRKHGDKDAAELTDDDIKLLQIAVLFHDSAREDENVDQWDHESAMFLYVYLTQVLHVDKHKARQLAEAVANKDPNKQGYFTIIEKNDDQLSWQWEPQPAQKNIFQKIIHDADCLDIIRARPEFNGEHLDFYKQYEKNDLAFDEMAQLITEARSLIAIEGDTYKQTKASVKKQFEHKGAYEAILNSRDKEYHPIMIHLGKNLLPISKLQSMQWVDRTPYDPNLGLTEENVRRAVREGKVFSRGIGDGPAIAKKTKKRIETLAELEIRKMIREMGIPTTSKKEDRDKKEGNPSRSVSMLGHGAGVFTNAGFLIVNPDVDNISKISAVDFGSGRGKKEHMRMDKSKVEMSKEEKSAQLASLNKKLKLGGTTENFGKPDGPVSNHVEIIYHIKKFSAIYFSNDPNLYNMDVYKDPHPAHKHSPLLQAIYLRNVYKQNNPDAIELPIFEYSGVNNQIKKIDSADLTDQKIINMWSEMCSDYIKSSLEKGYENFYEIYDKEIEDIKIISMFKNIDNKYALRSQSADINYDPALREKINQVIQSEREKLITEFEDNFVKKIENGSLNVMSQEAFRLLMANPKLVERVRPYIEEELNKTENIKLDLTNLNQISPTNPHFLYLAITRKKHIKTLFDENLPHEEILFYINLNKDSLYHYQTVRLFLLADKVKNEKITNYIKNEMKNLIKDKMENFLNDFSITAIHYDKKNDELAHLINFLTLFKLYPEDEKIAADFNQLLINYFSKLSESFSENLKDKKIDFRYIKLITTLQSYDLLNENMRAHINTLINNNQDDILSNIPSSRMLPPYLNAMGAINKNQNEIICQWLDKHPKSEINVLSIEKEFGQKEVLEDNKVFQRLLDHIPYTREESQLINLSTICFSINFIKEKYLPKKQFNASQESIIQDKINNIFNIMSEHIENSSDATSYQKYDYLEKNLSIFLEYTPYFAIPDKFVTLFNSLLKDQELVNYLDNSPTLQYFHESLPRKDERTELNALFSKTLTNKK